MDIGKDENYFYVCRQNKTEKMSQNSNERKKS
jgi:hypothetical protein